MWTSMTGVSLNAEELIGIEIALLDPAASGTKAVCPDEPSVFLDAPAIGYVSADHLLAVRGATQHEPLKGKQLGSGRNFDFCLPAKAPPIEDDCFLREPGEFRGLAGFQLCRNARGFVQRPIDLFSRL
jgi:hypothetical protein